MTNEFLRSGTARTFNAHGKLISSTRAYQLHIGGIKIMQVRKSNYLGSEETDDEKCDRKMRSMPFRN